MQHPLHAGARQRYAQWPWIGVPAAAAGTSSRLDELGDNRPVVVSALGDPTARHFYSACLALRLPIAWLTYEDLLTGRVSFDAFEAAAEHARGVYLREPSEMEEGDAVVLAAVRAVLTRVCNYVGPSRQSTNWSKPLHILALAAADTNVTFPHTSVTSAVAARCVGVLKAVGGMPTYAVDAVDHRGCHGVGPLLVQEFVDGREIRIHVIDEIVVAHAVTKTGVDWRVGAVGPVGRVQLTPDERAAAIALAKVEGLRFSGIDAIRVATGLCVLEVNPMPGYDCFERAAGGEPTISIALHQSLSSPKDGHLPSSS